MQEGVALEGVHLITVEVVLTVKDIPRILELRRNTLNLFLLDMVVEYQLHLVFGGSVLNHREAKADRRVVIILGVLVVSYVVNDGLVAVELFILEGNIQSSPRIQAFLLDEAHCRFV